MKKIVLSILVLITLECTAQSDSMKAVRIGSQIWTAENLNVDRFRNGDRITQAITEDDWKRAEYNRRPAWSYYNNDSTLGPLYGKLYNWYAVTDPRGLAPLGWHIPSAVEWKQLVDFLGGPKKAGRKMKSKQGWQENGNGDNSSGFNGYPGGQRSGIGNPFSNLGEIGYWWKTGELIGSMGNHLSLWNKSSATSGSYYYGIPGFSVRCVKD